MTCGVYTAGPPACGLVDPDPHVLGHLEMGEVGKPVGVRLGVLLSPVDGEADPLERGLVPVPPAGGIDRHRAGPGHKRAEAEIPVMPLMEFRTKLAPPGKEVK